MKNINPCGFFDEHYLFQRLTELNDPLVKLEEHIDWDIFKPLIETVFTKPENSNKAGRKPFVRLTMFKILILQSLYNLSDDQMEYQITDRMSFRRFLGIKSSDKVPDSKTVWKFRESLVEAGVVESLFDRFRQALEDQCILARNGRIVDASFVEVPRQRNTREENEQIKQYQTPEAWKEKPNKLRQKDVDARWTKKNNTTFFGYKNHVKTDKETKLIETYVVTSASVHDSQALEDLINKDDGGLTLHADSAYIGQEETVKKCGMVNQIHERGTSTKKLTDDQKKSNRQKSSIRCRVEHVFGFMTNTMKAMYIRTIGIYRAEAKIGLTNLTYNMMRCVQLGKPVYNVFLR